MQASQDKTLTGIAGQGAVKTQQNARRGPSLQLVPVKDHDSDGGLNFVEATSNHDRPRWPTRRLARAAIEIGEPTHPLADRGILRRLSPLGMRNKTTALISAGSNSRSAGLSGSCRARQDL
jgi:hypothetical protein